MFRSKVVAAFFAICLILGLSSCGFRQSVEDMEEIAKAKDACIELGGKFEQWTTDYGEDWKCNFEDGE